VLERLGAFVRYDEQTKTVTAIPRQTNITLPVGGRRALVGDRAVTLDAPAQISNGSVLVPLRFVAEALGAQVTFDVGTRTVAIALAGDAPIAAPRDASDAASVDVTVAGTVVAVYPDLAPPADRGARARPPTAAPTAPCWSGRSRCAPTPWFPCAGPTACWRSRWIGTRRRPRRGAANAGRGRHRARGDRARLAAAADRQQHGRRRG
jgi:hypothetical protein